MPKFACNLTGSTPSVSRPMQFIGEALETPIRAAKDMSTDRVADLRERVQALKFTWVIAEALEKLGFKQGAKINEYLKRQRSFREKMRRESEDVIHELTNLNRRNPKAAERSYEIMMLASGVEVNPFMPKARYEGKTDLVEIDGQKMTQADAWDLINEDINALRQMDAKAPAAMEKVFNSFQSYRRKLLRSIIQTYKDRAGEGNLRDDEVSRKTFEQIQRTKDQFINADNDAYITFLRTGNYVVNVYKPVGTDEQGRPQYEVQESQFFESKSEAQQFAENQKKLVDDPELVQQFKKTDLEKYMYGMGNRGAVNAFFDKLKPELEALKPVLDPTDPGYEAEVARIESFKDKLHNMSLLLYPETAVRKQLVAKRRGTAGYMGDVLKVYAIMSDRYASQISQLQYNGAIDTELVSLNNAIKDKKLAPTTQERAVNLSNELAARVLAVESAPTFGSRFANTANQLGFLWFLGLNPSSAVVNILQVPGVTLPWLSARFEGQFDNLKELTKAYATIGKLKGKYFTEGTLSERIDELVKLDSKKLKEEFGLTKDEVQMLKELDNVGSLRSGMQIYDINSIADMGGAYPGSAAHAWYNFNKASGYMFQKAELVNREVSALAAYRLARKKAMIGKKGTLSHEEAIKFADQAVEKSQGAYAEDQAPRIFMNPAVRVMLMFKKFPAHMATIYIQMFKDIFGPNVDPTVRRIARRQFTGMMAMTGVMAGVAGMPLYYIIRDTMNLAFGDEDEPYNFDYELRKALIEQLGPQAGNMIFRGVLGESGMDIGSRISYESSFLLGGTDNIPFIGGVLGLRDIKQGDTAQETMQNAMVEALGAGAGIVTGVFRGYDKIKNGDVYEGIEAMSPAFLRNPMKAGRFATEGALTARGDPIIEDITTMEVIKQALGFTPQRLSSQYKINQQIKDMEQKILDRRQSLLNQYTKAVREKDRATQREVMDEIREFNKLNPGKAMPITSDTIKRSLAKRESLSRETEKGIFVTKKLRPLLADEEVADQ
jgi:hypothetical protein